MQLCTWDSNLRLYLIVKGVLRQLETNNCSLFTCLATTMKCSQFVSMMHYLVNLVCTDYQNRALMKYLELISLDGNREASELTDGEICKYNQQNYEMLKDREERSTITTNLILRGAMLVQAIPSVLSVMQKCLWPILFLYQRTEMNKIYTVLLFCWIHSWSWSCPSLLWQGSRWRWWMA